MRWITAGDYRWITASGDDRIILARSMTAGVEPTNNVAERALRPAVLWRKGSFGSDTTRGSRFTERMLTVVATCRQQRRRVLDFLLAAGQATLQGTPVPSLLSTEQAG
jgi:transposase